MTAADAEDRSLIRIEPMRPEDLPAVVMLEQECRLNSRGIVGYRRALADPHALLLVAVINDHRSNTRDVIGLLSGAIVVDEMHIDNIAVAWNFRRRGIASHLLIHGFEAAQSKGALKAVLEVRSANSTARALYDHHGFILSGRRPSYYRSPPDDALIMTCRIGGLIENNH